MSSEGLPFMSWKVMHEVGITDMCGKFGLNYSEIKHIAWSVFSLFKIELELNQFFNVHEAPKYYVDT
jgi:hypothetical protein